MRHLKRCFALLMMLCLVASLAATAMAAPADTCTIRVFGGAQKPGVIKSITVNRGDSCNLGTELASVLGTDVSGTKYYTRSTVRESGKEEEVPLSFTVDKDRDFVLTYGIKGDQVTYYVRYVDSSGNALAERSGPFVANLNDRVYVAYVEVNGYQPDAYNRTATLTSTSNLKQSDGTYLFTFTYTRPTTPAAAATGGGGAAGANAAGAAANNAAGAVNNPANANQNAANQNAANQNANNQNANNPANPNAANPNAANPNAANPNANAGTNNAGPGGNAGTTANNGPLEIIDEDQVPLAVPGSAPAIPNAPAVIEPNQHSRIPNWALIAGAVVLVGLIAMLYWYLLFYRKKKKYASMDEDFDIAGIDVDDDF